MTRDFRFDRVDDTDSRLVWAYREIDLDVWSPSINRSLK
jgi:hypothetical protein